MNPHHIVVCKVQRNGGLKIFKLLAESIRQAWSSPIEGSDKRRFFAVLHMGGITGPVEAVRAAIVAESRGRNE